MDEQYKELREIQLQLDEMHKKERKLREEIYAKEVAGREDEFAKVKDKIFWCKSHGFNTQNYITIVKAISCEDWSPYNSCNTLQIQFVFHGQKFVSFSYRKETVRCDMLGESYKEATNEELIEFQKLANEEIIKSFNNLI